MDTTLRPIGVIVSPLTDLSQCPKQGDEGAPEAWVEIAAPYVPGLDTLSPGLSLTLLTWLDRADRDVLSVHPRGDTRRRAARAHAPTQGGFAQSRKGI